MHNVCCGGPCIRADGEVNVLNTSHLPNENALYGAVSDEKAGPAVVRIPTRILVGAAIMGLTKPSRLTRM